MSHLFTPYTINRISMKNRIVMAPMVMNSSETDGMATDFHFVHYVTRAVGGVGTIIVEATAVEPRGRITERDLGIWCNEQVAPLARIVKECKKYGATIGIQLAHAGRKSTVKGSDNIAPSPIAFDHNNHVPNEMTIQDIEEVTHSFKEGARRAYEAGFDFIEIHGAHGYLINTFMSPLTNKREDEYGETHIFLRGIVQEIRTAIPKDMPVFLRVSGHEYHEKGNRPEDIGQIINKVKNEGIDIVHVSSGGVVPAPINVYPGYQVPFAQKIREGTGLPVIAGGLVTTAEMAEEMIANERCDFIFLARELLRNPYWSLQAADCLKEEIHWPKQYIRGKK